MQMPLHDEQDLIEESRVKEQIGKNYIKDLYNLSYNVNKELM